MGPNLQELFSRGALVACSHVFGLSMRSHMTAGLDGFRGSRPYQLVGIGIPLMRSGFSRSVGSTDCAITCFSLSQACGAPQVSWLCCDCCVSIEVRSAPSTHEAA